VRERFTRLAGALATDPVPLDPAGSVLGRQREAFTYSREALELYAVLARDDSDLYETTYRRHLAELRRTYDLLGDQPTSMGLHPSRDTKDNDQP
jgi:hypothetical protein